MVSGSAQKTRWREDVRLDDVAGRPLACPRGSGVRAAPAGGRREEVRRGLVVLAATAGSWSVTKRKFFLGTSASWPVSPRTLSPGHERELPPPTHYAVPPAGRELSCTGDCPDESSEGLGRATESPDRTLSRSRSCRSVRWQLLALP